MVEIIIFSFRNATNANGGYVHHRFRMGNNGNAGVPNAYRVSPNAWTMVTLTNEGNGGVAKTYIDGGVVQSQNLTNDIYIENIKPIYIAANENGNANWYKRFDSRFPTL